MFGEKTYRSNGLENLLSRPFDGVNVNSEIFEVFPCVKFSCL